MLTLISPDIPGTPICASLLGEATTAGVVIMAEDAYRSCGASFAGSTTVILVGPHAPGDLLGKGLLFAATAERALLFALAQDGKHIFAVDDPLITPGLQERVSRLLLVGTARAPIKSCSTPRDLLGRRWKPATGSSTGSDLGSLLQEMIAA